MWLFSTPISAAAAFQYHWPFGDELCVTYAMIMSTAGCAFLFIFNPNVMRINNHIGFVSFSYWPLKFGAIYLKKKESDRSQHWRRWRCGDVNLSFIVRPNGAELSPVTAAAVEAAAPNWAEFRPQFYWLSFGLIRWPSLVRRFSDGDATIVKLLTSGN